MSTYDIYSDIAKRTNGDIYVGVVGPVRTGKSTFIRNFVNTLVLPNILDQHVKERTQDEMPQSGDGRSIMTTQPKFVPNQGAKITVCENVEMTVRLVDCVGYLIEGAVGYEVDSKPRLVKTPWDERELPFSEAAEIGTNKVISQHSTIGVLLTCDGTISDIDRLEYVKAEERVYQELKKCNKPFVVLVNSKEPMGENCQRLTQELKIKYSVPTMAIDAENLTEEVISEIFANVLNEFMVVCVDVEMPDWLSALPYENKYVKEIVEQVSGLVDKKQRMSDYTSEISLFENSANFEEVNFVSIIMGEGKVVVTITPKPHLYYAVLSEECGCEIANEYHLVRYIKELSEAKVQYDKFKDALTQVEQTGYGVVYPNLQELTLEEPTMVKQGTKFGVKLKASASSLHIMKVDINTEVSPIVGSEQQSEDLVKYLMLEFENDPQGIWETKMFGKSLSSLVNEGLQNKLVMMPTEVQRKMRKTLGRIVNEGKGGVICILL